MRFLFPHNFRRVMPYIWLLPALFIVVWISLYPGYRGFIWSLHQTRYVRFVRFIGFENYVARWTDPRTIRAIINSGIYVGGSLAFSLPLGLLLALILSRPIKFRSLIRTILIIPWVTSQTVSALLWTWMLNPSFGLINYWLAAYTGVGKIDFLGNPRFAMLSLVLINAWRSFSFPMVMFLAAIQSITEEIYEAASMDGASRWKLFTSITLPLIKSTFLITLIMLTLNFFNMVTLIFLLTSGGPGGTTETLSYLVFSDAFLFWRLGSSAALGFTIFLINATFSVAYIRLMQRGGID